MLRLDRPLVVEGKYDKIKLSRLVDTLILTTDGFRIFRDREKLAYLRGLAAKDGLIIFTDSDAAGFKIRGYLKGAVDPAKLIQIYTPDIFGRERRKASPSKEGKLGVEGMEDRLLIETFLRAGVVLDAGGALPFRPEEAEPMTKADLFSMGLSGQPDSAARRRQLQALLGLPAQMSAGALLQYLNYACRRDEFYQALERLEP
ncbi:MAG: DUF4093 domain-containing protein [Provencibacterium sp.]|nr:DUF4093 domain-containing protein [Provencibacterium sp.]